MRVICVVGDSGTGKTRLIERLAVHPVFSGVRLALLKRTHHDLDWHPAGKDSTRFWETGVAAVGVVDPGQSVCFSRTRATRSATGGGAIEDEVLRQTRELARAAGQMRGRADFTIAEGFASAVAPKIWLVTRPPSPDRRGPPPGTRLIATVADLIPAWSGAFAEDDVRGRDDVEALASGALRYAVTLEDILPV